MSAPRRVAEVRAPDEAGAEERAWTVVRAAHGERSPRGVGFVRTTLGRGRRLLAVSRIAEELAPGRRPAGYPALDGWCCTSESTESR